MQDRGPVIEDLLMFKRNKFIVRWFEQHEKMMHSHSKIQFGLLSTEYNSKIKTYENVNSVSQRSESG